MQTLHLNFMLAAGIGIVCFYLGIWVNSKVRLLRDFFIPEAVVGGLIFALVKWGLHAYGIVDVTFDSVLQKFFMTLFFTSIGFAAKLSFVKTGGHKLILMGVLLAGLILCQDILGITIAKLWGEPALLGVAAGSVPLVGGHGSAGVFGPVIQKLGVPGALAGSMAMATFGLIMGGLLGGPVASRLIKKYQLHGSEVNPEENDAQDAEAAELKTTPKRFMRAMALLLIAMGIGSIVSDVGEGMGYFVPPYLGSILVAAIMRNLGSDEQAAKLYVPMAEIVVLADIGLNIFLSMALMSLNMWELQSLAGPLIAMALAQMLFMSLFTYFVVFRALGSTYEAAVIVAAICGFGLGAVPTAMANMEAITRRYGYAPMAFILVPLIGSMADGINATVVITFINIFK